MSIPDQPSAINRLWRDRKHLAPRHLVKFGVLLILVFGTYAVAKWVDFREPLSPVRIVALLNEAGPLAPLVLILLMATAVVISPIPSLPLDLAAGATFGTLAGTAYGVIGAEIGAIVSFLIGRALGREALVRILKTDIVFCERCSDRHLVIFVLVARLFPVFSFDLVSYGAGLTNMSLKAFAVATLVGMIPPTFAITSLGGSLIAGTWPLVIFGLAMVVFLLAIPKLVVRYPEAIWVQWLRGGAPVAGQVSPGPPHPAGQGSEPTHRCDSCGGELR